VIAGPLINRYGYRATAIIYCAIGLAASAWFALRWRAQVWQIEAPGNKH
jgi:hypothetical protein